MPLEKLRQLTSAFNEVLLDTDFHDALRHAVAMVPNDVMYTEVARLCRERFQSPHAAFGYVRARDGAVVNISISAMIGDQCVVKDEKGEHRGVVFTKEEILAMPHWGEVYRKKLAICSNESCKVPEGHIPVDRVMIAPLVCYQGRLVGLLAVANKREPYTKHELEQLQGAADQMAPVLAARLERNELIEQVKELQKEVRDIRDSTA